MLQQLVILGSNEGENKTIITFAGRAADFLHNRYMFYTNWENMLPAVQQSSSVPFKDGHMLAKSACNDGAVLDRCAWVDKCICASLHPCLSGQLGHQPAGVPSLVLPYTYYNNALDAQVTWFSQSIGCNPYDVFSGPCDEEQYYFVRYFDSFDQASKSSTDPNMFFWVSTNPAATLCTSKPECQGVTAEVAACLYTASWTSGACTALANDTSAWQQLIQCTSCGSPNNVVWGSRSASGDDFSCYAGDTQPVMNVGHGGIYEFACSDIPNVDSWQVCPDALHVLRVLEHAVPRPHCNAPRGRLLQTTVSCSTTRWESLHSSESCRPLAWRPGLPTPTWCA